jgi:hypothetical protein
VAWTGALAVLPFVLLIRGGVLAYRTWGLGPWGSLFVAAIATGFLLGVYARATARRLGAAPATGEVFVRAAMAVAAAYVAYALVFVASANVTSDEVRAEYRSLHPLLRVAASSLVLLDADAVITDAGRTREDYVRMGLPAAEASLHFEQANGFVHALDIRTRGRAELRNLTVRIGFRALGFSTLRHGGTGDHLHVSLGLPR